MDAMAGRRVFISYSHKDRAVARMIDATLRVAGIATFLDERDIKVGDMITEKIYSGIASSTDLLYVISEHSLASRWTEEELGVAKVRQMEGQGFGILPVLIDSVELPTSLVNVRFADMRNWQDANQYRIASLELLRALGISPHLVNAPQLQWWITNRPKLVTIEEGIAECYHVADIAIGYYHYFSLEGFDPYRWAWKWMYEEAGIEFHIRQLRELTVPATALDRRFKVVDDSVTDILKALENGYHGDEMDMRLLREATGRIAEVLSELESEALTVTLSVADIGERP
jgi:hypothetical protein